MKIIVEIPKEFECDYNKDKFNDFFGRLKEDFPDYMHEYCLCGNYEKETLLMLEKAFKESEKR